MHGDIELLDREERPGMHLLKLIAALVVCIATVTGIFLYLRAGWI
jgi:hypothetical protein